jgi:glutamyl-tRNA synthetase
MKIVTRFAPSPTGYLHIGGARTALYNWLFAQHHQKYGDGGKFLLRIEDTDRARSNDDAVKAILDGMKWLGLKWEGEAISQFDRGDVHRAAVEFLLANGNAYKCYSSPEELNKMRITARAQGLKRMYDGRWRNRDESDAPTGIPPVIRLKASIEGGTTIADIVQGDVNIDNEQMDDMVLLRADGTPTYMLAVVVDDHDMGVTHVIRGDDHLTNAFRQTQLYQALGWHTPTFAHIPLIHGPDGAKMSKRHGALGVDAYRDQGFLPAALCNYLLRLGWSHGDEEMISTEQAIEWFDLSSVGRSAAKFDFAKLTNLNGHYIRNSDNQYLSHLVMGVLEDKLDGKLAETTSDRLEKGMDELKDRAKTISELSENALFYAQIRPLNMNEKALNVLDAASLSYLAEIRQQLSELVFWQADEIENAVKEFAQIAELKLGGIAQPLRAALTGTTMSPSIFNIMAILGRDEALGRLDDAISIEIRP